MSAVGLPEMQASSDFRDGLLGAIPSLRAFAFSLTGQADRADDLVQETLTKAWAHQKGFQPGTNLKAWLYTILRRVRTDGSPEEQAPSEPPPLPD